MRLSNNLNEPKGFGRNGLPPEGCRRPLVAPADLWYSPAPRPPGGRQEEFMKPIASPFAVLIIVALATAMARAAAPAPARDEKEIRERLKGYAPVKLQVDLSPLSRQETEALGKIVAAVNAVDEIYWKQQGRQTLEARAALAHATHPVDRLYRDFVQINYGPFDIRKEMERFLAVGGGGARRPGAGFY